MLLVTGGIASHSVPAYAEASECINQYRMYLCLEKIAVTILSYVR